MNDWLYALCFSSSTSCPSIPIRTIGLLFFMRSLQESLLTSYRQTSTFVIVLETSEKDSDILLTRCLAKTQYLSLLPSWAWPGRPCKWSWVLRPGHASPGVCLHIGGDVLPHSQLSSCLWEDEEWSWLQRQQKHTSQNQPPAHEKKVPTAYHVYSLSSVCFTRHL